MIRKPRTNLEQRLAFVRELNVFNKLPVERVYKVSELLKESTNKKHQFIYQKSDPCDRLFFLYAGSVKVGTNSNDDREVIKSIVHPKAMFGEWNFSDDYRRSEFAIAMDSNTITFELKLEDFMMLMKDDFDFAMSVINIIGKKLRYAEKRLESLILKDARSRIIDFLKDNAENFGRQVGFEMLLKHSMTQQDIANFTGTSRQTVTSVLNDLRRSNKIHFNRKSILIRDLAGLQ